jgi:hypothetical protein
LQALTQHHTPPKNCNTSTKWGPGHPFTSVSKRYHNRHSNIIRDPCYVQNPSGQPLQLTQDPHLIQPHPANRHHPSYEPRHNLSEC